MKKLIYSEAFYSLQGEGRFVGQPSIFLRTFGCNFQCPNFGVPRGCAKSDCSGLKVEDIDPNKYKKLENLPLVEMGCDSYVSWHKDYKKFNNTATPRELADKLLSLCPNNKWLQDNGSDIHLVVTGGEPLLGWQKIYPELFELLISQGLKNITFETNGTQPLKSEFLDYLINSGLKITFSVSPKLSISGHKLEETIKPYIVAGYGNKKLNAHVYLKFVVSDEIDFDEMIKVVENYRDVGARFSTFYAMPVGGTEEGLHLSDRNVADLCLLHGVRYTPRMHVNLFGNGWSK